MTARHRVTSPDSNDVHALNEICGGAVVAEDEAEAALQCKAGDADVEAFPNARQLVVLMGKCFRNSPRLDSHLQRQSLMSPGAECAPKHDTDYYTSKNSRPCLHLIMHADGTVSPSCLVIRTAICRPSHYNETAVASCTSKLVSGWCNNMQLLYNDVPSAVSLVRQVYPSILRMRHQQLCWIRSVAEDLPQRWRGWWQGQS